MFDAIKQLVAATLAAILAVELESQGQHVESAAKKASAIAKIESVTDSLLPGWMQPVAHLAEGFLVDSLVAWAGRSGFFASFSDGSLSLPSEP